MTPRDAIPPHWAAHLGDGPVALGHDIGTTTKGTSNPSTLVVMEKVAPLFVVRLVLAWKTADPRVSEQLISCALDDLASRGRTARRLNIDASNETFHATNLRRAFLGRVPVGLIKSGEKVTYKGEDFNYKQLLGSLYANAFDDGLVRLPAGDWIATDHRLVKREGGAFVNELGKGGWHGDTFDGGKLAYWGLIGAGGPIRAAAAQVGDYGSAPERDGLVQSRLRRRVSTPTLST